MTNNNNPNEYDDTEAYLNATKGDPSVNTENADGTDNPIVELGKDDSAASTSKQLSCSPIPFTAFMLLGAIWGSAFLFIRFGVDPKTGFPPVRTLF